MKGVMRDVVIECSETVSGSAETVWRALRRAQGNFVPNKIVEEVLGDSASMAQRATAIDDQLLLLLSEMTAGHRLPWSSYKCRLRVEPVDTECARVSVTCLAVPTMDPVAVERVLDRLMRSSLGSFMLHMEKDAGHHPWAAPSVL